ncbi:hypothetical protein HD554DRAFT_2014705 [Boletus coccyginus]|nr:hypothetical protein HD554DRAFT_2014705 [Boletus coccyginus]
MLRLGLSLTEHTTLVIHPSHPWSTELLAGKIVCTTGSSRGISRACAVESAKHGATSSILTLETTN